MILPLATATATGGMGLAPEFRASFQLVSYQQPALQGQATNTPTKTPKPTKTPTPTATSAATNTATASPTATITASLTQTPLPAGPITVNYIYDPLNRLTEANYAYDAANRLTGVDSAAYTWDNNGNASTRLSAAPVERRREHI